MKFQNVLLSLGLQALSQLAAAAPAGDLAVTYANKIVQIKGSLTGLPKAVTNGGIHVHSGTKCYDYNEIGGHLLSNYVDGWLPTTYSTDTNGAATISVSATSFVLETADDTVSKPSVEGRCIVLHGKSSTEMGTRVAIGKIVKGSNGYTASIGHYPGATKALASTPSGTITVTLDGDKVTLSGSLTGLGKSLTNAGIHIHTGTDCTGGSDPSKYNEVVGGHLLSGGDGFLTTKYSSNADGAGSIDISTPKGAYVLNKGTDDGPPSVEDRCIVIHDGSGTKVGVGKIVCGTTGCSAKMGKYPDKPASTERPRGPQVVESGLIEEEVKYSDGAGGDLFGFLIYRKTSLRSKRAGLLVLPGPYGDGGGKNERDVARNYAGKGYVTFLPDYFPSRNSENDSWQVLEAIGAYKIFLKDSAKAQKIIKLGYDQLATRADVDADRISAIGFCFGGAMALNLARSGAKLVVAASLHGEYPHLDTNIGTNGATGTYNTQHFVEFVGDADPLIPKTARESWDTELKSYTDGKEDKAYELVVYPNAVHAFSIKYSETFLTVLASVMQAEGNTDAKRVGDGIPGVIKYDEALSKQSFEKIDKLLDDSTSTLTPTTTIKISDGSGNACGVVATSMVICALLSSLI